MVPIPPDLVFVVEHKNGKKNEIKLVDSDYWNSDFWEEHK